MLVVLKGISPHHAPRIIVVLVLPRNVILGWLAHDTLLRIHWEQGSLLSLVARCFREGMDEGLRKAATYR